MIALSGPFAMSPSTSSPQTLNFKGGFSLSSKPKVSKTTTTSSLGKRPRAALYDDSASDDEHPPKHEAIASIENGKTLTTADITNQKNANRPLIIEFKKTRDFRDEIREAANAKKGKNLLPPEVIAARAVQTDKEIVNGDGHEPVKWGLNVSTRDTKVVDAHEAEVVPAAQDINTVLALETQTEQTEDERAIDALMGISSKNGPKLVIESTTTSLPRDTLSEEDTYRRAIRLAPDPSTLEDYERIPVEDYGAALLRGMGWNGKEKVKGPKVVERRANRLGLGAKALKNPEELGAWAMGGKKKYEERRPKPSEYKERQDRRREERDKTYGSSRDTSGRRERDERSDRDSDRYRDDRRGDDRYRDDRGRERDRDRRR